MVLLICIGVAMKCAGRVVARPAGHIKRFLNRKLSYKQKSKEFKNNIDFMCDSILCDITYRNQIKMN